MRKALGWIFFFLPILLVIVVAVPKEYWLTLFFCMCFVTLLGASIILGLYLLDDGSCSHPVWWPSSCYEVILMARRGANALAQQGQPDVIICPPVPPSAKRHWVERPLPLLINLIKRLHHPGTKAILMDPFCGSGSTLVAAYRFEGITAIGCELDPTNRNRAVDYLIEDYIERQQTLEDWGDLTDG